MITQTELESLVKPRKNIGITIYMPWNDGSQGDIKNPALLNKYLREAEKRLLDAGLDGTIVDHLLLPAYKLVKDETFWRDKFATLALFIFDDVFQSYKLPFEVEETIRISRYPYLRPILREHQTNKKLYLLVLAAGGSRLFRFDMYQNLEITPPSLKETSKEHASYFQIEREANYHIKRAGRGPTKEGVIAHGSDNTEQLDKQRSIEYARFVAHEVRKITKEQDLPLVIAGAKSGFLAPTFRETYEGEVIDDYIPVDTNPLDLQKLQEGARRIIVGMNKFDEEQNIETVSGLFGTGLTETDPEKVVEMAFEGRIDSLFVDSAENIFGTVNVFNDTCETKVTNNPEDEDLTNVALSNVWDKGGKVFFVSSEQINNMPMMASLRY